MTSAPHLHAGLASGSGRRADAPERGPVLLVFVDGVGIGAAAAGNPFAELPLPGIGTLVGGPLVGGCARSEDRRSVSEVDATLGVDGLPQSGTGQTALFTGVNAAAAVGRHVPAFPGPRLRAIIEAEGLPMKARRRGLRVAFANAFTPAYLRGLESGERRASVTVHAARCAGLELRSEDELARDRAVTWDLERDFFRRAAGERVQPVAAEEAGRHLARLAAGFDLTIFETFLTDLVGHGRIPVAVPAALTRLDRFLGGLLAARDPRLTVVLTSDHGNIEEPEHGRHTRNPVPVAAVGPGAASFAGLESLIEVAPAVLLGLGAPAGEAVAAGGLEVAPAADAGAS